MTGYSLFLFKKKREKYFLTLDIGTEAVKVVIFERGIDKNIILGASLQYYESFGVFDSRDFEAEVFKKAILKAIVEAQNQAKIKTNSVLLSLPVNFSKGRVIFQSFERKNPQKIINKKEEEVIQRTILKEAQKNFSEIYALKNGILPEDLHFTSLKIFERKIDGYEVLNLQGFGGKKIDFSILISFVPKDYLKKFEEIIQNLNLKIFQITNLTENLLNTFDVRLNGIFLDVGGKISQVFLIWRGKLKQVEEFEEGGRNFLVSLSERLGINLESAQDIIHNYSKGKLSEEVRKKIKEIFLPQAQRWFEKLKSGLLKERSLPSTIFLFGGGSLLPEIKEILTEGDWGDPFFVKGSEIILISPRDLKGIDDKTNSLTSPQFTPTLLLCYGEYAR